MIKKRTTNTAGEPYRDGRPRYEARVRGLDGKLALRTFTTMKAAQAWERDKSRVEQQMARVNVSDAVWVEFRSACLVQGEHVSEALGRLVEAELRRRRRGSAPPRVSDPTLFELPGPSDEVTPSRGMRG